MYVEKIAYGSAVFRFTADDLNRLATACDKAVTELVGAEDAELNSWLQAALSAFVAAWTAATLQMDTPVGVLSGDDGEG